MQTNFPLLAFLLGLVLGSLYILCARLYIQKESLANGLHACPGCRHRLMWWEHLSLADRLIHRGLCRSCGKPLPVRFACVEVAVGVWELLLAWKLGWGPAWLVYTLFGGWCIVLSLIDLERLILPDILVIPGSIAAFLCAVMVLKLPYMSSMLGGLVGVGSFLALQGACLLLFQQRLVGPGDVKLMLLLGFLLGLKSLPLLLGVAFLSCYLFYQAYLSQEAEVRLPFGPFLCFGLLTCILLSSGWS